MEWKCHKHSARRSIISSGPVGQGDATMTNNRKAKQKSVNKQGESHTHVNVSMNKAITDINKQLKKLQEGQQAVSNAIQRISYQMVNHQQISSTVKEHGKRLKKVEDKTVLMKSQIEA